MISGFFKSLSELFTGRSPLLAVPQTSPRPAEAVLYEDSQSDTRFEAPEHDHDAGHSFDPEHELTHPECVDGHGSF